VKVIIAGKRDCYDYQSLIEAIGDSKFNISEVVSGGASGADSLGERFAEENGIPLKRFPADWDKHGFSAGPIRNQAMSLYADALIALWDGQSKGTGNMVKLAKLRGLKIYIKPI